MSNLFEYVITLKNFDDLDQFYLDMENSNGIIGRAVDCCNKRPISRNTHYMLTDSEASLLKNDQRVLDVMRADRISASIRPLYTQTGNFSKSAGNNVSHLNWGMVRCIDGKTITGWGSDSTPSNNKTITFSATGKNVDVVIIDGHINPAHPEMAKFADGTGGTRVVQLDWNTLTGTADIIDNDNTTLMSGTYTYPPYIDGGNATRTDDNNHGVHVAGTACGNTLGWARDSNIYNISPYSTNPNSFSKTLALYDYIRAFHRTKTVNPITGTKNPTICNCSYGNALLYPYNYGAFQTGPIVYVNNNGVETGTPVSTTALSNEQLLAAGIYASAGVAEVPIYVTAIAADIQDALNDGIHIVGAAGNESSIIYRNTDSQFNDYYYEYFGGQYYQDYHHRGTAPGSVPGVLCVGAIDTLSVEYKATFSNCGPRIDVYAPGRYINSSLHSTGLADSRNASYQLGKYSGTSMASPQVCGVLACALEIYPTMTPAEGRFYIINNSTLNQITDTLPANLTNLRSLNGSSNRYLYAKNHRQLVGQTYPPTNHNVRPSTGQLYPRVKRRR